MGESLERGDGQPGRESASLGSSSNILCYYVSSLPRKGRFVIPALFSSESPGEDEKPVPVTLLWDVASAVIVTNTCISYEPLVLAQLPEARTCVHELGAEQPGKLKKKEMRDSRIGRSPQNDRRPLHIFIAAWSSKVRLPHQVGQKWGTPQEVGEVGVVV